MKVINKLKVLEDARYQMRFDYETYYNDLVTEKEIGLLGHECRFIVKLISSFHTEVLSYVILKFFNTNSLIHNISLE